VTADVRFLSYFVLLIALFSSTESNSADAMESAQSIVTSSAPFSTLASSMSKAWVSSSAPYSSLASSMSTAWVSSSAPYSTLVSSLSRDWISPAISYHIINVAFTNWTTVNRRCEDRGMEMIRIKNGATYENVKDFITKNGK
jgi:hypothetical protein